MRKLVIILFLFCYIAATIGLSFSLIYCEGKFKGISFNCSAIECCCDDETDKDCCDGNIIKIEKTDDHNRLAENLSKLKICYQQPETFNSFQGFNLVQYDYEAQHHNHFKPPAVAVHKSPLYILHSVFRI